MLLNYSNFISKFANIRNGHVSTILQYFLNIFKNIYIFSFVSLENYKWAKVADKRRRGFKEKDQQMLVDGCRLQSACGCVAVSQTGKCGLSTIWGNARDGKTLGFCPCNVTSCSFCVRCLINSLSFVTSHVTPVPSSSGRQLSRNTVCLVKENKIFLQVDTILCWF